MGLPRAPKEGPPPGVSFMPGPVGRPVCEGVVFVELGDIEAANARAAELVKQGYYPQGIPQPSGKSAVLMFVKMGWESEE